MGIWIELRCENRGEESSYGGDLGYYQGRCWSLDNSGPGQVAHDTVEDVIKTKSFIEDSASASGWRKTREGWICPFCKEAMQ